VNHTLSHSHSLTLTHAHTRTHTLTHTHTHSRTHTHTGPALAVRVPPISPQRPHTKVPYTQQTREHAQRRCVVCAVCVCVCGCVCFCMFIMITRTHTHTHIHTQTAGSRANITMRSSQHASGALSYSFTQADTLSLVRVCE
jgi:hypothetical protein